jgi:23S rRNA pseudouridine2457 synthase
MKRYLIFYKPFNVLSQFSAEGEKMTLSAFFEGIEKNIYPVGRLDYDSEGLLILTNDKELTHRLLDPNFEHQRTYWVQVEGLINDEAIKKISTGVVININGKQHHTKPAIAKLLIEEPKVPDRDPPIRFRKNIPTSWLSLTLTEGKNRQVRRMTAAVGFPTLRLIRHSIGGVTIEGMKPGSYRELHEIEKALLFNKQ